MKREAKLAVMLMALGSFCFASHPQEVQCKSNPLTSTFVQTPPLPDLVIRQLVAVKGDDKKLRAHIINIGGADAGGCNLMLYYHRGGQVVKTGTNIPPIQKGKDFWIAVNNDKSIADASSISVRVDDPDRVKESNELNNSYRYK
jgi:hypothetical protein